MSAYLSVDIGATNRAAFVFFVEFEANFSGDAQRCRTIMRRALLTRFFAGDTALAFNNEGPAAAQAGQLFALPGYAGFPENGRVIRWQISFATVPTTVNIQLQTAINDVDAQHAMPTGARNMNSTLTGGDNLVATGVRANFVRAKVVSITGEPGVTVQILG